VRGSSPFTILPWAPCADPLPVDRSAAQALLDGADSGEAARWTAAAGHRLRRDEAVVFAISEVGPSEQTARELAIAIATALAANLVEDGLPRDARIEVDVPQATNAPADHPTRTLLPHHDGGHCSYLTPSLVDVPDWQAAERTFSDEQYCTTAAHKLYQGILVLEPGDGRSVTAYYPWIQLIARAFERRYARPGTTVELAIWLGENLRAAHRGRPASGAHYPSMAACLGARADLALAVVPHCAEEELDSAHLERYPDLARMARSCPCGLCPGPSGRVLCHLLGGVLGLTWTRLRQLELALESRRFDFVLGHNLTLLHAGIEGGRSRALLPVSVVLDTPAGPDYEAWLARQWRSKGQGYRPDPDFD
jgi:hypothetical protein